MGFPGEEDDSDTLDRNPDPPGPLSEAEREKGPLVLDLDRQWLHERVAQMAFNAVRHDMKRQMDRAIEGASRDAIEEIAKDVAREPVEREVRRLLDEGWQGTDQYGQRQAVKHTLSTFVLGLFTTPINDGYSGTKGATHVQKIAAKIVDEYVHKELSAEIAKVREALKAQVDGIIAGKFVEALRNAVGLAR